MSPFRILGTTPVLAFSVQLMPNAQAAPLQPIVVPAMQKDLADVPGKEVVMLTIEDPPGAVSTSIGTMRMPSSTCWKGRSSNRSEEAGRSR
jgi:hypothetical protein